MVDGISIDGGHYDKITLVPERPILQMMSIGTEPLSPWTGLQQDSVLGLHVGVEVLNIQCGVDTK
jgi:hypothetical protein